MKKAMVTLAVVLAAIGAWADIRPPICIQAATSDGKDIGGGEVATSPRSTDVDGDKNYGGDTGESSGGGSGGILGTGAATPTVTDVTAKQRYPWNGLVDISCKVSGVNGASNGYRFVVVAVDKDSGKEYAASHFSVEQGGTRVSGWEVLANGDYNLLWDARSDLGQVVCERMTVQVTVVTGASVGKVQLWEGGPYWADRNIGADKPWEYGLYFWWGDTTGNRPSASGTFNFNFYYNNSAIYTYWKWGTELENVGWLTSAGVLAPSHDAAHVKWGGGWRMPTYQELYDLCYNKCDWTWTTLNGVKGYVVCGRGAYASNSIFLPAAGCGRETSLDDAGSVGCYWSSVPMSYYDSRGLYFSSSDHYTVGNPLRSEGRSVRPVQGFTK